MRAGDLGVTRVHLENVDREAIGRYYLKCELGRAITSDAAVVTGAIDASVDEMKTFDMWRLLEALSWTARINSVFAWVTDIGLDWHEVQVPIAQLVLTGSNPTFNEWIVRPEIGRDPVKMARHLRSHFASGEYIADLEEFRPDSRPVRHTTIMVRRYETGLHMVDGTHRILQMAMSGKQSVRTYLAVDNGKRHKSMVGDSSLAQLAVLYRDRYKKPEQRESITDVALLMAKASTDGRDAIQTYWIDHQSSRAMKRAGEELISRLK